MVGTEIKLYEKQKEIVEQMAERFKTEQHIYLAGEMGVGKTYMGAYLVNMYRNTQTVVVVCPTNMTKKWREVVGGEVSTQTRHTTLDTDKVNVISHDFLRVWSEKNHDLLKREQVFFVFDEIHLLAQTDSKREAFTNALATMKKKCRALHLTGTIMEGNRQNVGFLIRKTHPVLTQGFYIEGMLLNNFTKFVYDIWLDISVNVSLDDVQSLETSRDEIRQDMLPIEPIPLSPIQEVYHEMIQSQLLLLTDRTRATHLATTYVDNPLKSVNYVTNKRTTLTSLKHANVTILANPLEPIPLSETSKFMKLKSIVDSVGEEKVLVYVNEQELATEIIKTLHAHGIPAFGIDGVRAENYGEYINEQLETHQVCVVDPLKVNVGLDIQAESLVWYQMMPKLDKMIQAQRRVYRMSSEHNSKVTIMVYDLPEEMDKARELSNASKHNAATYGTQEKGELAQLTGILLGDLK